MPNSINTMDNEARLGWQAAQELLRPFGAVAANFSEAIRLLVHHYELGSNKLPLAAEKIAPPLVMMASTPSEVATMDFTGRSV